MLIKHIEQQNSSLVFIWALPGNVVKYFAAKMCNGTAFRGISVRRLSKLLIIFLRSFCAHVDMKALYFSMKDERRILVNGSHLSVKLRLCCLRIDRLYNYLKVGCVSFIERVVPKYYVPKTEQL